MNSFHEGCHLNSGTISISFSASASELEVALRDRPAYVRISHTHGTENNLIRVAYRDDHARQMVTELANNGFFLYMHSDGESKFVHRNAIPELWHRVKNGEFQVNQDGLIYTYEAPKVESDNPKLLVVFSSIHSDIFTASLMRHFTVNFEKAQMFMTPETAVLRIADLGGVVGGFYMPTTADSDAGLKVQRLLDEVRRGHGIDRDRVVLYGASKGGTAAVYHGVLGGYRFVAVDPVISDDHYETKYRDSHFTSTGVFPESKQQAFERLLNNTVEDGRSVVGRGRWAVICSDRSPQFKYISSILMPKLSRDALFVNSNHPGIQDHPDVAPKTMAWAIMLLNMNLNGFRLETGTRTVV